MIFKIRNWPYFKHTLQGKHNLLMSVESFRTVQNDSTDWVRMVLAWCETTGYETTGYETTGYETIGYDKFESNRTI